MLPGELIHLNGTASSTRRTIHHEDNQDWTGYAVVQPRPTTSMKLALRECTIAGTRGTVCGSIHIVCTSVVSRISYRGIVHARSDASHNRINFRRLREVTFLARPIGVR